jgi:hypothetical protein
MLSVGIHNTGGEHFLRVHGLDVPGMACIKMIFLRQ